MKLNFIFRGNPILINYEECSEIIFCRARCCLDIIQITVLGFSVCGLYYIDLGPRATSMPVIK